MSDEIDRANEVAMATTERAIALAAKPIPPGEPGRCAYCGGDFARIINDACGRCRDRYRLP
jgi:predicted amidophosphoribosyltransferase